MKYYFFFAIILIAGSVHAQPAKKKKKPAEKKFTLPKRFPIYTGPDYSKTVYPINDTVYDQYVGETIAGYKVAEGWRSDTLSGFN